MLNAAVHAAHFNIPTIFYTVLYHYCLQVLQSGALDSDNSLRSHYFVLCCGGVSLDLGFCSNWSCYIYYYDSICAGQTLYC